MSKKDEQYCYLKGYIKFSNITQIDWIKRDDDAFSNDCYDNDYGNIDNFYVDDGKYYLQGDWGEVIIHAKNVEIVLLDN